MREFYGDITKNYNRFDLICITTNGVVKKDGSCVMGAGIAAQFRALIPELPFQLGDYIKEYGNRCFLLDEWKGVKLASFPSKHRYYEKADINLIIKSCRQIVEIANKYGYKNIALPRPGCSNGRLFWYDVKEKIEPFLDDRFIICHLK